MPSLSLGPHTLHVEQNGVGEPVLLLHHATASSRNWRKVVPALAERFQVLTYDRPGFGRSSWLADWPLDYIDRDAAELEALLDCLDIGKAALVGHSDGAALALLTASRLPQRVRCVVAEAPHVSVETPRCPEAVSAFAAEVDASPALQEALARDHGSRGVDVIQRWARRWLDPEFWSWDISDALARVSCPVLVIHGADDPYFSLQHSQMIAARLAQGQLHVIDGAGHVPHDEARQQFLALTLDFLEENAR